MANPCGNVPSIPGICLPPPDFFHHDVPSLISELTHAHHWGSFFTNTHILDAHRELGGGGTGEGKDNWYGLEPACYRVAGVLKLRKVLDPEPSVSPCKYRLQTSIGRFLYFRRMVKFNSWFFLKRKDYSTPIETIQILLSNVRCVIIKPTFDAVQEIEALYKYTISIQWPKFFRQSNFWHMRFF